MQGISLPVVAAVVNRATPGSRYQNHIIPIGRRLLHLHQQTRTALLRKTKSKRRSECGR